MNIKTTHTDQDNAKNSRTNKTNIFRNIKNSVIGFSSLLLLGTVTFPMIVALIFLAQLTTTGHLESGFSYVLFG